MACDRFRSLLRTSAVTSVLLALGFGTTVAIAPPAAAEESGGGHTYWESFGERGNFLLRGHVVATPGDTTFAADGTPGHVHLRVHRNGMYAFDLDFHAPEGSTLQVGETISTGPGGLGRMTVRSTQECAAGAGWFTFHELAFGQTGVVTKVSVTFDDRCDGDWGSMFGTLAFNADAPPQPLPGLTGKAPGPVFNLAATPAFAQTSLSWRALTPPDLAETVVRGAAGSVPPASVSSGFPVAFTEQRSNYYVDNTAVATGLNPGTAYSFSVFVRDTEGKVSPATSITVGASAVTLTASSKRVAYGDEVTLSGSLRSAAGGVLAGRTVEVWCREPGTSRQFLVGRPTTDARGNYSVKFGPARTFEYAAFFDGGPDAGLGDISNPVRVGVAMGVDVADNVGYGVLLGRSFKIATVVGPDSAGLPVKLQEKVRGRWVTVAAKPLKGGKPTVFTVKGTKLGLHKYRVFKAGNRNYANGVSKILEIWVTPN